MPLPEYNAISDVLKLLRGFPCEKSSQKILLMLHFLFGELWRLVVVTAPRTHTSPLITVKISA